MATEDLRQLATGGGETGFAGGLDPGGATIGKHLAEGEHAIHRTGAEPLLEALTGDEGEDVLTPHRPTTQVRRQVHHRAVAAGAGHQIAVQPVTGAGDLVCLRVDPRHACRADALTATGFDDRAAGDHAQTLGPCFLDPGALRVGARIGDGHHLQAGFQPVQGHPVGVVVGGRQQ
ncbi:hypothetical protein D3C84_709300 [compost metagenome]